MAEVKNSLLEKIIVDTKWQIDYHIKELEKQEELLTQLTKK